MIETDCVVCGKPIIQYRYAWLFRCPSCGLLSSNLEPRVNEDKLALDETQRARALHDLRLQNFSAILTFLGMVGLKPSARVLDVGCGHGWFLSQAVARGYNPVGIEPDVAVAAVVSPSVREMVRVGYFPERLLEGEQFDAVIFNDVFEHLPRPLGILDSVKQCLSENGLLVINLPLANGVFFRLASVLDWIGYHAPFERMWQKDFPSPHLWYFSSHQLVKLAIRCGFRQRLFRPLSSFQIAGLWQRLRYDPDQGLFSALLMWPLIVCLSPILRLFPADTGVLVFDTPPQRQI